MLIEVAIGSIKNKPSATNKKSFFLFLFFQEVYHM